MKLLNVSFVLYFLLFCPQKISHEFPADQWIIWNVGQGQWVTRVNKQTCVHFDFGGEFNPIDSIVGLCRWRMNALVLSHTDSDHFNFMKFIKLNLKNLCLLGPSWQSQTIHKMKAKALLPCFENPNNLRWYFQNLMIRKKDDNFRNQMAFDKKWLIPGDAPIKLEKMWMASRPPVQSITHLLLGHHGSKTSTSKELLAQLVNLKQCVSSSRQKKYGHPHRDVRIRIKSHCHLIRTEDWGNIHFLF